MTCEYLDHILSKHHLVIFKLKYPIKLNRVSKGPESFLSEKIDHHFIIPDRCKIVPLVRICQTSSVVPVWALAQSHTPNSQKVNQHKIFLLDSSLFKKEVSSNASQSFSPIISQLTDQYSESMRILKITRQRIFGLMKAMKSDQEWRETFKSSVMKAPNNEKKHLLSIFMGTIRGKHKENSNALKLAQRHHSVLSFAVFKTFTEALNIIHSTSQANLTDESPNLAILSNKQQDHEFRMTETSHKCDVCKEKMRDCFVDRKVSCPNLAGYSPCLCGINTMKYCSSCFYTYISNFLTERSVNPPDTKNPRDTLCDCSVPCPSCGGAICPYSLSLFCTSDSLLSMTPYLGQLSMDNDEEIESTNAVEPTNVQPTFDQNIETAISLVLTKLDIVNEYSQQILNVVHKVKKKKADVSLLPFKDKKRDLLSVSHDGIKRPRRCANCKVTGHYKSTCPLLEKDIAMPR